MGAGYLGTGEVNVGVIKTWAGWLLALCAVLFIIASCQNGALDDITNKVKDKAPSVHIDK